MRITVQDPAPTRAHVDSAVHARVTDDLPGDAELVRVVVDALPGGAAVVGSEEASYVRHFPDEVKRGIGLAGRGFAEADRVALLDHDGGEVFARVGRVIELLARAQPDFALDARDCLRGAEGELVLGQPR